MPDTAVLCVLCTVLRPANRNVGGTLEGHARAVRWFSIGCWLSTRMACLVLSERTHTHTHTGLHCNTPTQHIRRLYLAYLIFFSVRPLLPPPSLRPCSPRPMPGTHTPYAASPGPRSCVFPWSVPLFLAVFFCGGFCVCVCCIMSGTDAFAPVSLSLSLSLSVSLSVSGCLSASLPFSLSLSISLSLSLSLCLCLCHCLSVSVSVSLSLCLCFSVSISLSLSLYLCRSVSVCVAVSVAVCAVRGQPGRRASAADAGPRKPPSPPHRMPS
eukprot:2249769-Rhodomonas_salina.1